MIHQISKWLCFAGFAITVYLVWDGPTPVGYASGAVTFLLMFVAAYTE